MNKFKYTFWFYTKEHFTKKALIWIGVYFVATIGIMFAINHFGGGNDAEIAIVQESSRFIISEEALETLPERQFHFVDDQSTARQMLEDEEVSDVFIISGEQRPELSIVTSDMVSDSEVELFITQLLMAQYRELTIVQYDLPASAVAQLNEPLTIHFETTADEEAAVAAEIINFVLPFTVYMFVLMSGQMIANSVASEKTSRVMEVMLGKVHPTITMLSKVLATLIGILVPIVSILAGVVAAEMLGFVELESLMSMINEFIPIEIIILAAVVLFIGYFCFIFFFTAAGAIANSVESLTYTLQPVVYATMVPFFLLLFIDLDSSIMNILVYVPFISPYVIVQRFLMGYSSILEVGIIIGLMTAFSVLALIVSARLYMNGISHTSEKVTVKDFKKLLQK